MKKVITVVLLIFIFLTPVNIKAEELQGITNYNQVQEVEGNMIVTYKSNKIINIDKGDKPNGNLINTGDSKMLEFWIMTSLFSIISLLILILLNNRKSDYEKEIG